VKRKADTTTPCPTTSGAMLNSPASIQLAYKPVQTMQFDHSNGIPASIACRRESRTVKRPKKDLDDEPLQHNTSKVKKEPLNEQMKYCGVILKELFSKKHAVRSFY
jgi:hypothetical protein